MPPPEGGRALTLRQGLLAIDPATRNVSKKIPGQIGVQIGAQTVRAPPTMAVGEGALWTTDLSGIVRVDATSGAITHIPLTCHDQVTVGLGAVWTACGGAVVRVDPFTFEQREIDLRTPVGVGSDPGTVRGLSLDRGTLWVSSDRDFFYRLDAIESKVEYRIEDVTADVFAVGEGALWAVDRVRSIVTPVATGTGRPHSSIPIPGEVDAIAAGAGGVWLLDREGGTVTRIDPQTETVKASIGIGAGGNSITAAFDSVWITLPDDQDLVRIDPLTGAAERISIGAAATYAAPDPQTGWLWLIVIPPAGAGR